MSEPIEQWQKQFEHLLIDARAPHASFEKKKNGLGYIDFNVDSLWTGFLMAKRSQPVIDAWQPMETAPKNTTIILDVGLPWSVVGVWNEASWKWCYAELNAEMFEGKCSDTYFENEHEVSPIRWQPMPEINTIKTK